MDIKELAKQFKTVEELQVYSAAQYHTIIDLNQKLNQKDEEIEGDDDNNKTPRGEEAYKKKSKSKSKTKSKNKRICIYMF